MSFPVSLLDLHPYDRVVTNGLPSVDLRAAFGRVMARHLGDLARGGVSAHLSGDFNGLARVAEAHRADGFDLMPCADPAIMPPGEGLWLALVAGHKVVATTAALYRYLPAGTSLRECLQDMTLFYAAPEVARQHGADVRCRAPLADRIGGHTVLLTAGWVHPGFRGARLIRHAVRLCALAAYARWSPDWVVGLVEAKFPMSLVTDLYGFLWRCGGLALAVPGWPALDFTVVAASRAEFEQETVLYAPPRFQPGPGDHQSAVAHWGRLAASAAE